MRRHSSSGFALVLVIIAIFFTSVLLLVAAENARTLQFQADRLQARSIHDNLQASALTWIQHRVHLADFPPTLGVTGITLKSDPLSDRHTELRITENTRHETGRAITVQAACTYGKQRLNRVQTHIIRPTD
jgi:type II secretory pathway pseudopilin PulG